jgi:predicted transcriptional regulator
MTIGETMKPLTSEELKSLNTAVIDAAVERHHIDGDVEVDLWDAGVSFGDDPGAYVKAWVWVPAEDLTDEQQELLKRYQEEGVE